MLLGFLAPDRDGVYSTRPFGHAVLIRITGLSM